MGLLGYWCFRSIRCWNQHLLHPSMHKMLLRKYEEDIIINKFHKGDLTILESFTYTANGKRQTLAWVNSRQPLVSPPNDVWETSTEIPYWWRVTTSASDWFTNQALPVTSGCMVKRHRNGISELLSQTSFGRETSGSVAKCRLFSQARQTSHSSWKFLKIDI